MLEKLKILAEKGISPSTIGKYLYNPIAFYKERVLGIREVDEVEETVAANTLGTIVHDTLEELYIPHLGQFLSVEDIISMKSKAKDLVEKYFIKHFRNGETQRGKNRLIFEVANRYVERFLATEKSLLKEGNKLKIIATEQNLETTIEIEGISFPIKIKGIVDRIDELNGVTRIIDYKTGMVKSSELKVADFFSIKDYKYSKAIQILLYSLLFSKNNSETEIEHLEAGIYSLRNLKEGFLRINFSEKYRGTDYEVTSKKLDLAIQHLSLIHI